MYYFKIVHFRIASYTVFYKAPFHPFSISVLYIYMHDPNVQKLNYNNNTRKMCKSIDWFL